MAANRERHADCLECPPRDRLLGQAGAGWRTDVSHAAWASRVAGRAGLGAPRVPFIQSSQAFLGTLSRAPRAACARARSASVPFVSPAGHEAVPGRPGLRGGAPGPGVFVRKTPPRARPRAHPAPRPRLRALRYHPQARRARALPPLARAAPPSLLRNVATRAEGDNGAAQAKGKGKGKNKGEEEPPSAYRDTVILPDTPFSMRANSKTREPELQAYWAERRIYERLLARNESGGSFVLHDGPPYANGDLHVGHALNKVLKDVVLKYHLISGRQARFVPGWDCHGLPIELKVLQTLSESERAGLTPLGLRARAAAFAKEAVDRQMAGFKRYGVWGDWDQPYLTLQPEYEAAQIGVFAAMATNGHIYRGKKPVHWSPSSRTALAEAELEYPEGHTSPSIYGEGRWGVGGVWVCGVGVGGCGGVDVCGVGGLCGIDGWMGVEWGVFECVSLTTRIPSPSLYAPSVDASN